MTDKEFFDEVKKLLGLKDTDFILDSEIDESKCDIIKVIEKEELKTKNIVCILKDRIDAIHEGVHAFFAEREQRIRDKLEKEEFKRDIDFIYTIRDIEEITARIIEINLQDIEICICNEDIRLVINRCKYNGEEELDEELGRNINNIMSIYDYYCVMPHDIELFNKVKGKNDPVEIYNVLAEYVGADKLII